MINMPNRPPGEIDPRDREIRIVFFRCCPKHPLLGVVTVNFRRLSCGN